ERVVEVVLPVHPDALAALRDHTQVQLADRVPLGLDRSVEPVDRQPGIVALEHPRPRGASLELGDEITRRDPELERVQACVQHRPPPPCAEATAPVNPAATPDASSAP